MRTSVALSQRLGAGTFAYANRVAELGFDGVFVFDHLVPLGDPRAPALEASAALGALVATSPIRVGALVLRATLRPTEVTAAIAATLASIATIPPVIGLGAGDGMSRPETQRFGLPFPPLADRLAQLAASVAAVRREGVTAWVGGLHPAVAEIARDADGWNLWEPANERLPALLAGRPTAPGFTLSWGGRIQVGEARPDLWLSGPEPDVVARLRHLVDLGFDEVILAPLPPLDPATLDRIAEVVARL